jgi:hypothetical protein
MKKQIELTPEELQLADIVSTMIMTQGTSRAAKCDYFAHIPNNKAVSVCAKQALQQGIEAQQFFIEYIGNSLQDMVENGTNRQRAIIQWAYTQAEKMRDAAIAAGDIVEVNPDERPTTH